MTHIDDLARQHHRLTGEHEEMPLGYYLPHDLQQVEQDLISAEVALRQFAERPSEYTETHPEVEDVRSALQRVEVAVSVAKKYGPSRVQDDL